MAQHRKIQLLILSLAVGGLAAIASADNHGVQVVTRASGMHSDQVVMHPVVSTPASHVEHVVTRSVVEPAAVVSRGLAMQPVHPHLIEVKIDHSTIYLDPQVDYLRQDRYSIMPKNYLTMALQRHSKMAASMNRIVRNPLAHGMQREVQVQPRMIILKPDYLKRQHQEDAGGKKGPIPSVPASPDSDTHLKRVALVDVTPR